MVSLTVKTQGIRTQTALSLQSEEMAQRFVMNARIIGAVQRASPKLKMFMLSVSWSDESEVIVYRSFKDFRKFHRQLKKRFPQLNPLRRKDRLIPKFKGEARKASLQQKGSKRSVRRMRFLESYCSQLLQCDESVTRSAEVTQFFTPKDHDLQPDFTKNTVMVMQSGDLSDGGSGHVSTGNVSHPFATQTYRCVAPYETKDTKNRPFKVVAEEKLDVLIKEPTGWWLVENEDKKVAWFPAPYLELLNDDEAEEAMFPAGAGSLFIAVRSYSTKKQDEIPVNIGSVVEVLRKSDDGWWLIRFNGKTGYIPSMYLQPYNNPRAGMHSLQSKLHSSTLNLALRAPPGSSASPSIREEEESTEGVSRLESTGRLHKARSLDVLSESWASSSSQSSGLSALSSGSDSSQSSREESTGPRRDSISSSSTFSSVSSKNSTESQAPKVPARPRAEEIMTRCTTMTRKAALASQARLQLQPSAVYAR